MTLHRAAFGTLLVLTACDGELRLLGPATATDASGPLDVAADTATLKDAPACTSDGECAIATLHCSGGRCVACSTDAHCTKEYRRCDVALHRCVECGIDGDCKAGSRCEPSSRRCVRTCDASTSCLPDTASCDLARGLCVRCRSDVECEPKKHCETGSGTCGECVTDAHCAPDRPYCDMISSRCVRCLTSDHCPAETPLCDPTPLACVAK